jgi:transcription elongation factor Elf1
MKLIGRIVCLFKGHKRGKRQPINSPADVEVAIFACPRCGHQTRYKVKDQSKGTPGDES